MEAVGNCPVCPPDGISIGSSVFAQFMVMTNRLTERQTAYVFFVRQMLSLVARKTGRVGSGWVGSSNLDRCPSLHATRPVIIARTFRRIMQIPLCERSETITTICSCLMGK